MLFISFPGFLIPDQFFFVCVFLSKCLVVFFPKICYYPSPFIFFLHHLLPMDLPRKLKNSLINYYCVQSCTCHSEISLAPHKTFVRTYHANNVHSCIIHLVETPAPVTPILMMVVSCTFPRIVRTNFKFIILNYINIKFFITCMNGVSPLTL